MLAPRYSQNFHIFNFAGAVFVSVQQVPFTVHELYQGFNTLVLLVSSIHSIIKTHYGPGYLGFGYLG